MSHQALTKTGNLMMVLAALLFAAAFTAAFVLDQHLSLGQQILGHMGILLGATLLKIGYVVRLTGIRNRQLSSGRVTTSEDRKLYSLAGTI